MRGGVFLHALSTLFIVVMASDSNSPNGKRTNEMATDPRPRHQHRTDTIYQYVGKESTQTFFEIITDDNVLINVPIDSLY